MAGYIIHGKEPDVVITQQNTDALIKEGDGDLILLYLAIQRSRGPIDPVSLEHKLGFSQAHIAECEQRLAALGLISMQQRKQTTIESQPAIEGRKYTPSEVGNRLKTDNGFASLIKLLEEKLGKRFDVKELSAFMDIYVTAGLPLDAIYLLVSHLTEKARERGGPYRKPSMYQIEKAAWAMAKDGVKTYEDADAYIRCRAEEDAKIREFLSAIGVQGRQAAESELKFLRSWVKQGFTADAISLAYDRTMLHKHELHWGYMNGILRRWDDQGLHSAADVLGSEQPKKKPTSSTSAYTASSGFKSEDGAESRFERMANSGALDWASKYMKQKVRREDE